MATTEKIEEKLLNLINQADSFAIALTGEWGIGKTHFWKNFYEKNHNNFKMNKYSYVSLFGIDSLESFKYQIAINTHDTKQKKDYLLHIKKAFSSIISNIDFPKLEAKGFSLSVTQSMINSIISNFIEDTVICIDDFERKSDKLDTREIMGLINFLKEEKKCKIIMILHEDKSKNLEVFREYKEKVFDDVLILDENISIIRKLINNNENFDIYENFYNILKYKNLRFYIKVDKDYRNITSLNKNLSLTSKRYILENIFVIRMIFEKGVFELTTEKGETFSVDVNFLLNFDSEDDYYKARAFNSYLNNFTFFYGLNEWGKVILQHFTEYQINNDTLEKLIKKDLISDEKLKEEKEFDDILTEFHSLKTKPDFINRLYDITIKQAKRMRLGNIYFSYKIINYEDAELANNLEKEVKEIIDSFLKNNFTYDLKLRNFFPFGESDDIFAKFLEEKIEEYKKTPKSQDILTPFLRYFEDRSYLYENLNLDSISKEQLKEIIWIDINDKQYRRQFIASVVHHPAFSENKREEIRQWTVDILREEATDNPDSKAVIEMWLNDTNELKDLKKYL
ncbi:P-loop NTPase fold protein [Aggregatibacter actinomycetemcomitans]|uniref:P-loop NTPase fold protein n=1 Tax=Aggregatibacter actinomycetemcomitans TaxID=714 RepID=UPI001F286828|nr:P-loop NTPase fold protein [Aggregatibacter actinomycetemcomitans]